MMGAFLDLLGIAHEDGLISDESAVKPEPKSCRRPPRRSSSKSPPDDVSLYFATLVSQDPETWQPRPVPAAAATADQS